MDEYESKYLWSPHWRAFRKLALDEQRQRLGLNICDYCENTSELQVHHLTYERLGSERLEDVSIVCKDCHDQFHGRNDKGPKTKYWREK
jgi:5-methylcytosine-specific restriction endonuclease McrA